MSTDLVQTIVTLSQMLATSTTTVTRLEAELKAAERAPAPGPADETLRLALQVERDETEFLKRCNATQAESIMQLEADLKEEQSRVEYVKARNVTQAERITELLEELQGKEAVINGHLGRITQLKADLMEAKLPKKGTLPMAKNPNRTYIEGVAYQVRTIGYKVKHKELPVATLKVFRDDAHAKQYLQESAHTASGKGAPARLGAVIVECEVPPTPEIMCRSTR